jgi:hypothetical protein
MVDKPAYTLTAVDRDSGEEVEYALTAQDVERMMIVAEGLPDPGDVDDGDGDD